jgi:hypothetical protein
LNLVCVDPAKVHLFWPQVKSGVRLALERGVGGLFEETEKSVLSGVSLVWLAVNESGIRGVLITDLIRTDDGLQCEIVTLHGEGMKDWLRFLPDIEQFARNEGCTSIRVTGREGWSRILTDYDQIGVVLEKRL